MTAVPMTDEQLAEVRKGVADRRLIWSLEEVSALLVEVDQVRQLSVLTEFAIEYPAGTMEITTDPVDVVELRPWIVEGQIVRRRVLVSDWAPAQTCRECGCVDEAACDGGCSWVKPNLCSACVPREVETVDLVAALRSSVEAANERRRRGGVPL